MVKKLRLKVGGPVSPGPYGCCNQEIDDQPVVVVDK